MAYGVVPTGFAVKPLSVCKSEIEDLFRGTFGEGISLDSATPEGQFIGILSERESEIWDLAEEVYSSRDPEQATGSALTGLCAITGTVGPKAATRSELVATLGGTAATVVGAGSQASVATTGVKFATKASATLVAVDAWQASHAYVLQDRCANDGNIYECITAGTSASSGGPTGEDLDITDGTVHWRFLGAGDGAVDVELESVETGPQAAPARTLTEIETPVSGWSWVTNREDATPGEDQETNAALRIRRRDELAAQGAAALDAIRAEILQVDDVTACTVFENDSDVTDGDGRPPHSIEVLVSGGADQDLWDAILRTKGGGIYSHGTEVGTAEDEQGVDHTVRFSRPAQVEIYCDIELTVDADLYPADGDTQVKAALVTWTEDNLDAGDDVITRALFPAVLAISGVIDIVHFYVGTSSPPTSEANITIGSTEISDFDTARITVTS
jgi:uncharacterized phage protein gp47/JayE